MSKHIYRSKKVNEVDWDRLRERWHGQALLLAVDVAKTTQYAELSAVGGADAVLLRWDHLEESRGLVAELKRLGGPVTVVMESSGTYGDSLRHRCREAGFAVYQASAKRVHDAQEVFDGVPSLHDPKAARLIAQLHRAGLTRPWRELDERERALAARRREFELYQGQYGRCQNRLEAFLSRHWPEVLQILERDSVTLEQVLKRYGSPAQVAACAEAAATVMRQVGGHFLAETKVQAVIASAGSTLGEPCVEAERCYLMALATELEHSRLGLRETQRGLEAVVAADAALAEAGRIVGGLTVAILLSLGLDPRRYDSARAYQKALGLNLKEKSSGLHQGEIKLTKRGSALARKYLYFAALRLLRSDPVIARWYAAKQDGKAKLKAVIALVRKLALALWYLVRGQRFDARKLVWIEA